MFQFDHSNYNTITILEHSCELFCRKKNLMRQTTIMMMLFFAEIFLLLSSFSHYRYQNGRWVFIICDFFGGWFKLKIFLMIFVYSSLCGNHLKCQTKKNSFFSQFFFSQKKIWDVCRWFIFVHSFETNKKKQPNFFFHNFMSIPLSNDDVGFEWEKFSFHNIFFWTTKKWK